MCNYLFDLQSCVRVVVRCRVSDREDDAMMRGNRQTWHACCVVPA